MDTSLPLSQGPSSSRPLHSWEGGLLSRKFRQVFFYIILYPWCLMIAFKFPVIWTKTNYLYVVDNILEASASEEAFDLNLWSSHSR